MIRQRMHADGHFIFPVFEEEDGSFTYQALRDRDGNSWHIAFTEPFTVPVEILDAITRMQSSIEKEEGTGEDSWN